MNRRGAFGRLVLPLTVGGLLALSACGGDTPAEQDPGKPLSAPATATPAPPVAENVLPPVAAVDGAEFREGFSARSVGVERLQLTASGPGEVSGPAASVGLQLRNGSDATVDLSGVVVTATLPDGTPVDAVHSEQAPPPGGELAPGADREVSWVFPVPDDGATDLQLQVSTPESVDVAVLDVAVPAA